MCVATTQSRCHRRVGGQCCQVQAFAVCSRLPTTPHRAREVLSGGVDLTGARVLCVQMCSCVQCRCGYVCQLCSSMCASCAMRTHALAIQHCNTTAVQQPALRNTCMLILQHARPASPSRCRVLPR